MCTVYFRLKNALLLCILIVFLNCFKGPFNIVVVLVNVYRKGVNLIGNSITTNYSSSLVRVKYSLLFTLSRRIKYLK